MQREGRRLVKVQWSKGMTGRASVVRVMSSDWTMHALVTFFVFFVITWCLVVGESARDPEGNDCRDAARSNTHFSRKGWIVVLSQSCAGCSCMTTGMCSTQPAPHTSMWASTNSCKKTVWPQMNTSSHSTHHTHTSQHQVVRRQPGLHGLRHAHSLY